MPRHFAFLLVCLPMLFVPGTAASHLCGTTIVRDLVLDHDLICPGDGLIVGADGITLNLNGFTLQGSGLGQGVSVTGRTQVAITGGTIRNFAVAVRTNNSSRVGIKNNVFDSSAEGLDLQAGSTGYTIRHNEFRGHVTRAIMIRGSSTLHTIEQNTFTDNRLGILVFGGVNNLIAENTFSGHPVAGIRLNVLATGNLLILNEAVGNMVGIDFVFTPTATTAGNTLVKNTIATNDCGLKGPTAGNSFRGNRFEGNLTDACP